MDGSLSWSDHFGTGRDPTGGPQRSAFRAGRAFSRGHALAEPVPSPWGAHFPHEPPRVHCRALVLPISRSPVSPRRPHVRPRLWSVARGNAPRPSYEKTAIPSSANLSKTWLYRSTCSMNLRSVAGGENASARPVTSSLPFALHLPALRPVSQDGYKPLLPVLPSRRDPPSGRNRTDP